FRWTRDRSTLRRLVAGQQLHEGRFAGAVGPREPVTPTRGKRRGHVLEEHLRAEPHGDTADRNHGKRPLPRSCTGEELPIITERIRSTASRRATFFLAQIPARDDVSVLALDADARARSHFPLPLGGGLVQHRAPITSMKKLTLKKARQDFEQVLPRLVGDYESGRLVPFIGSGMSVGACTSWQTMIERLEQSAFGRK